jgi:hypothetical protein
MGGVDNVDVATEPIVWTEKIFIKEAKMPLTKWCQAFSNYGRKVKHA